jgi:methylthioxylose transferase
MPEPGGTAAGPGHAGPDGGSARGDLRLIAAAAALVALAAVVGAVATASGVPIHASAAPLFAKFRPHVGVGTPLAVAVAVLVVRWGPAVAARMSWRRTLVLATAAALAWTAGLALSRGGAGLLSPLTGSSDYLVEVPGASSVSALLQDFVSRVPGDQPRSWSTHVAGHPPGALLIFVALARLGLPGPGPAAALCVVAGCLTVPVVATATRTLCGEAWARRAVPFQILLPAFVWVGVSADAVFALVGALGLAGLVVSSAAAGVRGWARAAVSGLLLGLTCLLSYGAVLLAFPALAILAVRRRWGLALPASLGGLVALAAPALAGFYWWDGLAAVRERYYSGWGGERPYGYWVWADLAALALAAGPAVLAGAARLVRSASAALAAPAGAAAPAVLIAALFGAMFAADLTGMSKAEVERIWLPWVLWLPVACPALPARHDRAWLAASAVVGLLVEHLLMTRW